MPNLKGINLLITEKKFSAKKIQIIRLVKVGSVILLIFYCVVAVGTFSVWAYLQSESQKVQEELNLKKQRITALKKIESLQVVLKQRLSSLNQVLGEKKFDYKGVLAYLEGLSSPEITLGGIDLSSDGKLSFSGTATNAFSLGDFIEKVSSEEGIFSSVVLSSVSRKADAGYKFGLDVEVKQ